MIAVQRTLPGDWGWLDERLVGLVEQGTTGLVAVVGAVLLALGIGVVHAAGPGHGKVLVGSYLAGTSGRRRDAIALGALVAAMHSASVLLLGAAYLLTQQVPAGGRISQILEVVVALAVVVVGIGTLRRARAAARRRARKVAPAPPLVVDVPAAGAPTAGVAPAADLAPPADVAPATGLAPGAATVTATPSSLTALADPLDHHHALPPGLAPLSRSGVLALAAAGGLVPSPAAFLILVTAVALGRPWFGLALLGAFSLGLAATLAAVGLVVLSGRDQLTRASRRSGWAARAAHVLPTLAAVGVIGAGTVMLTLAVARW